MHDVRGERRPHAARERLGLAAAGDEGRQLAAAELERGGREQRRSPQLRRLGSRVEHRTQPADALGEVVAVEPERPDTRGQPEGALRIVAKAGVERRAEVVVVELEPLERFARRRQRLRPVAEARLDRFALARCAQALGRELAHGVEQPIARRSRVLDRHQRLVDEPHEQLDDAATLERPARADVRDRGERERAGEDREPPEEHALLPREQVVTPGDRRGEGLLARPRRSPSAGEDVEAVVEPGGDLRRRKRRHTRRGELEGERHAVEPRAERRDLRLVGDRERRIRLAGPSEGDGTASASWRRPSRSYARMSARCAGSCSGSAASARCSVSTASCAGRLSASSRQRTLWRSASADRRASVHDSYRSSGSSSPPYSSRASA